MNPQVPGGPGAGAEVTIHPPPIAPVQPPAPGQGHSKALLIAVLAVVVMLVAAGVFALSDPGQPGSGPAPEPIAIAALSGLLLSPSEAAQVVGSTSMTGNVDMGDAIYQAMSDKAVADTACMSLSPGLENAYQGSGFTASRQQFLTGDSAYRKIIQTVVSFADTGMAEKHVAATEDAWRGCAGRTVNLGPPGGAPDLWAVGPINAAHGIITTSRLQDGGDGWMCRDAIAVRNNVVIDVAVCGENIPESVPAAFVNKVDGRIRDAR